MNQPSNVTILDWPAGYYPAISASPSGVDRIAFARGSTNRVAAAYSTVVTQPLVLANGTVDDVTALWQYFDAAGYANRHTMSFRALRFD